MDCSPAIHSDPDSLPSATPKHSRARYHAPLSLVFASVMRGYVQEGTIWSDNASARLGL